MAAIEWSDQVAELLPKPHLRVRLRHLGPESRELTVEVVEPSGGETGEPERRARLQRAREAAESTPGLLPAAGERLSGAEKR